MAPPDTYYSNVPAKREHRTRNAPLLAKHPRLLEAELTGVPRVTAAEHAALLKAAPEVRAPAGWAGLRVEIVGAEERGSLGSPPPEPTPPGSKERGFHGSVNIPPEGFDL